MPPPSPSTLRSPHDENAPGNDGSPPPPPPGAPPAENRAPGSAAAFLQRFNKRSSRGGSVASAPTAAAAAAATPTVVSTARTSAPRRVYGAPFTSLDHIRALKIQLGEAHEDAQGHKQGYEELLQTVQALERERDELQRQSWQASDSESVRQLALLQQKYDALRADAVARERETVEVQRAHQAAAAEAAAEQQRLRAVIAELHETSEAYQESARVAVADAARQNEALVAETESLKRSLAEASAYTLHKTLESTVHESSAQIHKLRRMLGVLTEERAQQDQQLEALRELLTDVQVERDEAVARAEAEAARSVGLQEAVVFKAAEIKVLQASLQQAEAAAEAARAQAEAAQADSALAAQQQRVDIMRALSAAPASDGGGGAPALGAELAEARAGVEQAQQTMLAERQALLAYAQTLETKLNHANMDRALSRMAFGAEKAARCTLRGAFDRLRFLPSAPASEPEPEPAAALPVAEPLSPDVSDVSDASDVEGGPRGWILVQEGGEWVRRWGVLAAGVFSFFERRGSAETLGWVSLVGAAVAPSGDGGFSVRHPLKDAPLVLRATPPSGPTAGQWLAAFAGSASGSG